MWWYWIVPVVVSVVWLFHAFASWLHPQRMRLPGWLVLAGTPLVAVAFFFSLGLVHDTPYSADPRFSRSGIHDLPARFVFVIGDLLLAWIVVIVLEPILAAIRAFRGRGAAGSRPG